ncbi:hypothetical protein L873DRAFT_1805045 [Choiromyces venosus 120613-1]|uniref:Uncharacterized protein n=1 Tax=Choiromyces venosus 120613-1 TaxID=1336337 RepID=A0A3N4JUR9_9PEZI|nr:hypothetical protein L873DRAFT_1805045 [Choiromyces venosus 120613-1]
MGVNGVPKASEKNRPRAKKTIPGEKIKLTPARNEGKPKNQCNPEMRVCPNGRSSKRGEEESKTGPIRPTVSRPAEQR